MDSGPSFGDADHFIENISSSSGDAVIVGEEDVIGEMREEHILDGNLV